MQYLGDGSTPGLAGVVSSSDLVLVLADHKHPAWITKYQSLVPEPRTSPAPGLTGSWGLSPAQVPDSTCSPSMYIL